MEVKNCTQCNIEKHIEDFYEIYKECRICKIEKNLKRYYGKKYMLSNQRKIYFEKSEEKVLQKQIDGYVIFKETLTSYVELKNRLKLIEGKFSINDSENNQNFNKLNLLHSTKREI